MALPGDKLVFLNLNNVGEDNAALQCDEKIKRMGGARNGQISDRVGSYTTNCAMT
jgi:hypothetical protein